MSKEIKSLNLDNVIVRDIQTKDFNEILRINKESVHFLSPLSKAKLEYLNAQSDFHKVISLNGEILGFCLALREGSEYDSLNYRWFADHYSRFLYVDRVVVDLTKQSLGLGRLFYEEVFKHARKTGADLVAAEIDINPPNPTSLKFHEKFGFSEVGRQEVAGGKKIVSLQVVEM